MSLPDKDQILNGLPHRSLNLADSKKNSHFGHFFAFLRNIFCGWISWSMLLTPILKGWDSKIDNLGWHPQGLNSTCARRSHRPFKHFAKLMIKWGQHSFHRLLTLWNFIYLVVWKQWNFLLISSRNLFIEYPFWIASCSIWINLWIYKMCFFVKVLSKGPGVIK